MKILFLLTISSCAWAQFERPQLGKMLDGAGAVRTVFGISASVTLGGAELTGVLSSACSKTICLAKTDSSLVSATGSVDAPPGPAMFSIDGAAAFVWFLRTRQLAQWSADALTFLDANVLGEVLSIGGNPLQFAVRRERGEVWIVHQNGSAAGVLPRNTTAALITSSGLIYAAGGEIVAANLRLPLAGVTQIWPMSANYVQIRALGGDYALRLDRGTLFQLPGVAP